MNNHFELNKDTVGDILKSDDLAETCLTYAKQVAQNAGSGYKAVVMSTRVIVVPDTAEAEQDNLDNNTLLKAAHR